MENTPAPRDQLTVLVFKDNLSPRTFLVRLSWLTRLGVVLGLIALVTATSITLATRFYLKMRQGDPARALDLEHQLSELKLAYQSLENRKPEVAPEAAQTPVAAATPAVTVTVTAAPEAATPEGAKTVVSGGKPYLFSALPSGTQMVPDSANIPIVIDTPKASWSGRMLRVKFNIQYVREDRGTQQGRIVMLARGPETLLVHPPGAFARAGSDSLLAPGQGEYFSVSRFREVKAEFGPVRSTEDIRDVEILLLNSAGQVMIQRTAQPEAAPAQAAPKPAAPATRRAPPRPEAVPAATDTAAPAAPQSEPTQASPAEAAPETQGSEQ